MCRGLQGGMTESHMITIVGFALHQGSHKMDHGWLNRTSCLEVEALLDGGQILVIFISSYRDAIAIILVITNYVDVVARGTRLKNRAVIFICNASSNNWDVLPFVIGNGAMNCYESCTQF
jgi:hypothetical protein